VRVLNLRKVIFYIYICISLYNRIIHIIDTMTNEQKQFAEASKSKYNTTLADPQSLYFVYGFAALGIPVGMVVVPDWGLSTIMTYGTFLTMVACAMVCLHISKTRDLRGISVKMFVMQCIASSVRLSSTCWLNGYIPSDSSGDILIQLLDMMVAVFCLYVIYMAKRSLKWTYVTEHDTFPYKTVIWIACLVGCVKHPSLHGRPLFDTTWNISMFMECLVIAPQMWVFVTKRSVVVPACCSHYLFFFFLNRCLNFYFWWYGHDQLANHGSPGSSVFAANMVLLSHFLSLLMVSEFAWHYLTSLLRLCRGGKMREGGFKQFMV